MKKAFCNCKQDTNNTSTAKKRLKKIKINAKLSEKMLKLIKLYFLKNDDLVV